MMEINTKLYLLETKIKLLGLWSAFKDTRRNMVMAKKNENNTI